MSKKEIKTIKCECLIKIYEEDNYLDVDLQPSCCSENMEESLEEQSRNNMPFGYGIATFIRPVNGRSYLAIQNNYGSLQATFDRAEECYPGNIHSATYNRNGTNFWPPNIYIFCRDRSGLKCQSKSKKYKRVSS